MIAQPASTITLLISTVGSTADQPMKELAFGSCTVPCHFSVSAHCHLPVHIVVVVCKLRHSRKDHFQEAARSSWKFGLLPLRELDQSHGLEILRLFQVINDFKALDGIAHRVECNAKREPGGLELRAIG